MITACRATVALHAIAPSTGLNCLKMLHLGIIKANGIAKAQVAFKSFSSETATVALVAASISPAHMQDILRYTTIMHSKESS